MQLHVRACIISCDLRTVDAGLMQSLMPATQKRSHPGVMRVLLSQGTHKSGQHIIVFDNDIFMQMDLLPGDWLPVPHSNDTSAKPVPSGGHVTAGLRLLNKTVNIWMPGKEDAEPTMANVLVRLLLPGLQPIQGNVVADGCPCC